VWHNNARSCDGKLGRVMKKQGYVIHVKVHVLKKRRVMGIVLKSERTCNENSYFY